MWGARACRATLGLARSVKTDAFSILAAASRPPSLPPRLKGSSSSVKAATRSQRMRPPSSRRSSSPTAPRAAAWSSRGRPGGHEEEKSGRQARQLSPVRQRCEWFRLHAAVSARTAGCGACPSAVPAQPQGRPLRRPTSSAPAHRGAPPAQPAPRCRGQRAPPGHGGPARGERSGVVVVVAVACARGPRGCGAAPPPPLPPPPPPPPPPHPGAQRVRRRRAPDAPWRSWPVPTWPTSIACLIRGLQHSASSMGPGSMFSPDSF